MNAPYIPINCSYYDELEAFATLRQEVSIVYRTQGGEEQAEIRGVIQTFEIRDKVEYLKLRSGQAIRLDWLITVEGKTLPLAC
ncbi:MAG TPA: hypothetical protein DCE41_36535 [Cytophagales bacterium]|nr:hypothetical protein [Cytophagales bacterium]HAA18361.1 hypothetical protein [Cytophagales bacterium]HAP60345.1 hypothetical protein [Cytophagales bacterium]